MAGDAGLVRFALDDGTEAVFETTLGTNGQEELVSREEGEIPEAKERLNVLVRRIRPA